MTMRICSPLIIALCFALLPGSIHAQEIAIPVDVHMSLLTKVLAYDRSFPVQPGAEIVLGVVHECTWEPSLDVAKEVRRFVRKHKLTVGGRPVRLVPVVVSTVADLKVALDRSPISVLYFAPLRGVPIQELIEISQLRQIRTITGVAEYVEDGVAMGIGERDFRPLILVNLQAARAEGADLSAQVLQLAKVIP